MGGGKEVAVLHVVCSADRPEYPEREESEPAVQAGVCCWVEEIAGREELRIYVAVHAGPFRDMTGFPPFMQPFHEPRRIHAANRFVEAGLIRNQA